MQRQHTSLRSATCRRIAGLLLCLIATLAVTQAAKAVTLKIDFGQDGQAVDTGNGWEEFSIPMSGNTGPYTESYSSTLGVGGTYDVQLTGVANLISRIRTGVTYQTDLDLMLNTTVYNTNDMNVRFSNLIQGDYAVTTYHHDATVSHNGNFDITLSDALVSGLVVANIPFSTTGATPATIATSTSLFTSNGINPVDLFFDFNSGDFVTLSGITLEFLPPPPVPEPSSILLLSLGAMGLVRHTRKRSRQTEQEGCFDSSSI